MARVLRRPMFRLGGNTDQGIMSGVAPRQGYEHGGDYGERVSEKAREKEKVMRELIGQRPDRSLSNFMIDFGLDIASREPSGSIFSTAAASAKEPFQKYKASKAARGEFEQQIGLTAATSAITQEDEMLQIALKNLTKDERIMMEKRAQLIADSSNGRISFNEALQMELYRKTEHPSETRINTIRQRADDIKERAVIDMSTDYALSIAEPIQDAIEGKFDDPKEDPAQQISGRLDINQFYMVPDDVKRGSGDTYILSNPKPEGDYVPDAVYYNPQDGAFYWFDGEKFNIVVLPGQEAIKQAPTFE